MVFLVTDQNYHSAGDGKVLEFALLLYCSHDSTVYNYISFPPQLAGIVEPNDGSCNLVKIPSGEYEYARPLDQVRKFTVIIQKLLNWKLSIQQWFNIFWNRASFPYSIIGISFKYLFNNLPKLLCANEIFIVCIDNKIVSKEVS